MLKVMIVDDEMIVRIGIQSCINWEEHGCQVIFTCESGEEAIAAFERQVPDIVFTDIMMPEMDGIQLVEYIRSHYPKTKVIVLSCVNEIDYVKRAIKLGAEDYILKLSFTRDTMAELIERLRETIEKEQKEVGNQVFEMEVRAFNREENFRMLLSNTVDPLQKEQLLDRLGYLYDPFVSYLPCCLLADHMRTKQETEDADSYIRRYGLLNIIREYFETLPEHDLAFIGEGEILALFILKKQERAEEQLPVIFARLNHALKTHLNLTMSMGEGTRVSRLEIPEAYEKARRAAALRFFDGEGSFHKTSQEEGVVIEGKREVCRKLQEAVFKQDITEAFRLTEEWFAELCTWKSFGQIKVIRRQIVETWIYLSGYTLPDGETAGNWDDPGDTEKFWNAETLDEMKWYFKEGLQILIEYIQASKNRNPEIVEFLHYLNEHVDENISLERAAQHCALGKSQFCILFKKATGDTFINYFNGLKMRKAFALLSRGNIQVQEVADRLGLKDISYFSRLFKKYYNISPSDVKKM